VRQHHEIDMNHPPPPRVAIAAQPPCSDASWARRCAPLLAFLSTPRAWNELEGWASKRGMSGCRLRNMLAWLEGTGVAACVPDPFPPPTAVGRPQPIWYRSKPSTLS
jgi:hypothetical protein